MRYVSRRQQQLPSGATSYPGDVIPQEEIDRMPGLGHELSMGWIEAVEDEAAAPAPEPEPEPAPPAPEAEEPDMDPALANPCPHCGAGVGEQCKTASGKPTSPHAARG